MATHRLRALFGGIVLGLVAACGGGDTAAPPPPPAPVATTMTISAGATQSAAVGTAVAVAPAVQVLDQFGKPFVGAPVTFAVATGNGSLTGSTATTGSDGIARVG